MTDQPRSQEAALRALDRLEADAHGADKPSIPDGPAFANGVRYAVKAIRAALAATPPEAKLARQRDSQTTEPSPNG